MKMQLQSRFGHCADVPFSRDLYMNLQLDRGVLMGLKCRFAMADADVPTLDEIIQLTRSELTLSQDDEIYDCGRACVALLPDDPDMCLNLAYQHLHSVPYNDVKRWWRRLYVDAALRLALEVLEKRDNHEKTGAKGDEKLGRNTKEGDNEADWVTKVVKILDMALILTGAPGREELVELWFSALGGALEREREVERPAKRRKFDPQGHCEKPPLSLSHSWFIPETFPSTITNSPSLLHPIPRTINLSLEAFQTRISKPDTQIPVIIEAAIEHWPALHERPWSRPGYLLEKTLGGRRLVPVEVGRSYTDEGWGQKILSFGTFIGRYMGCEAGPVGSHDTKGDTKGDTGSNKPTAHRNGDPPSVKTPAPNSPPPPSKPQTGYLAQHDLFAQIPSLRADISIPDYCYADPSLTPLSNVKPVPKLEDPLLNAWFGPACTISPLHTDPYHNILAQVVGYKYVRLYAPAETENLFPRRVDENGIDMSNTSELDLDVAMGVWPGISCWRREAGDGAGLMDGDGDETGAMDQEEKANWKEQFAGFKKAKYVEGVLGPGECLYVPVGWWHYVRSLTPSFSVSFWFN
ncbi:Clavaminate synthase-like protein [Lentithecium fluviatile CBS 122367]|uniref:Clavaminate synthase-like protein n=1 Tax=Lentithecium fluviatile CBS 122367 TaxID=1168545 RepID=A0A6G1JI07_9PLEO|nr:Clavaminate synthase-like protein [Lentithecium fluviatile CBS 122367]